MVSPGLCSVCRSNQTPDKKLFTNTWIGGKERVPLSYLIYRWVLTILTFLFFSESFFTRVIQDSDWRYWLYLATWSRLLALLHYTLDSILVTARWRREFKGQVELSLSENYGSSGENYASSSSPLPPLYRTLWILANINCTVSLVSSLVYWPFFYQVGVHPLDMQNLSGHAVITLINLIDIFISDRPWRLLHAFHSQLFCLVYALTNFAYIEEEGTGIYSSNYMYSILDWSDPTQCLLTVLGLSVLIPVIHLFFFILYKFRCLLTRLGRRQDQSKLETELHKIQLRDRRTQQQAKP